MLVFYCKEYGKGGGLDLSVHLNNNSGTTKRINKENNRQDCLRKIWGIKEKTNENKNKIKNKRNKN